MANIARRKLTPGTNATACFFDIPGEVWACLSVTVSSRKCQCGRFTSPPFPNEWKHKWLLHIYEFEKYSNFVKISVVGQEGNNKEASIWVDVDGRLEAIHSGSYGELNWPGWSDFMDKPVRLVIRVRLDEDFAYLESRRNLPSRQMFKELFSKGFSTDVKLIANDGQSTSAHWEVLAARSPVFSAMRDQSFKESNNNEIKLALDFEALTTFLACIYTGQMDFESVEIAKSMFKIGDMFLIEKLKLAARDFLCESLNMENAVDLLVFSNKHSTPLLGEQALATLRLKTFKP